MMSSVREDGRGHWPRGKRRNQPLPQRRIDGLMRRVARLIERTDDLSLRRMAWEVGVSDRTIRRWIGGTDNPSADHLVMLQHCLDGWQG